MNNRENQVKMNSSVSILLKMGENVIYLLDKKSYRLIMPSVCSVDAKWELWVL
jgi:hypothetical protein